MAVLWVTDQAFSILIAQADSQFFRKQLELIKRGIIKERRWANKKFEAPWVVGGAPRSVFGSR